MIAFDVCPMPISPDLQSRALCFVPVRVLGVEYFVPITKEVKKSFGLKIHTLNNKIELEFKTQPDEQRFLKIMWDIAHIMYLQVRDTVGHEIEEHLSDQLKTSLADTFQSLISNKVRKQIEDKLPKQL